MDSNTNPQAAFANPAAFSVRRNGRPSASARRPAAAALSAGDELSGVVRSIKPFGAFVALDSGNLSGLIHISELTHGYVADVGDVVSIGDSVRVRVLSHDLRTGRIALSLKQSYERAIALGDDWGHPWGDDPNNPTKWVQLGRQPPKRHHHWEVDPRRRAPLAQDDNAPNARR